MNMLVCHYCHRQAYKGKDDIYLCGYHGRGIKYLGKRLLKANNIKSY